MVLIYFQVKSSRTLPTDSLAKQNAESETEKATVQSSDLPSSNPPTLPEPLQDLANIHRHFLKAVSIHSAHHGASSSIDVADLLPTITRLWKVRAVTLLEIRQMLALYTLFSTDPPPTPSNSSITSPFHLRIGGSVTYLDLNLNLSSTPSPSRTLLDEPALQAAYTTHLLTLLHAHATNPRSHLTFLSSPTLSPFPLLPLPLGTQTTARHASARQTWAQILQKPAPAKSVKKPSASAAVVPVPKSRQTSLLERIRAKKLAKQDDEGVKEEREVVRRHALGRLEEVINILRGMQRGRQQGGKPVVGKGMRAVGGDEGKEKGGRVAFSIPEVLRVVGDSVRVPVGEEVVGECLRLLAGREGGWVRVMGQEGEGGDGHGDGSGNGIGAGIGRKGFVVLRGSGVSGRKAVELVKRDLGLDV